MRTWSCSCTPATQSGSSSRAGRQTDRHTHTCTCGYRGRCCLTDNCVFLIVLHRNSSQWTNLWERESESEEQQEQQEQWQRQRQSRVVKEPLKELLTIRRVTEDDRGTYKVLDPQGLAISTTLLSIQGEALSGHSSDWLSACSPPLLLSHDSNPTVFFSLAEKSVGGGEVRAAMGESKHMQE